MNRDIENKFVCTTGGGEGGVNSKNSTEMEKVPCIKQTAVGSSARRSVTTQWGESWGCGREAPEEGDICVLIADSYCCTVETNKTL